MALFGKIGALMSCTRCGTHAVSPVAQRQSARLLTGRLEVRILPGEPRIAYPNQITLDKRIEAVSIDD